MKNKAISIAILSILWLLSTGVIFAQVEGLDWKEPRLKGMVKTLEVPRPGTGLKDFYVFDRAGNITGRSTLYRSDDRVWHKTVNTYAAAGKKTRSEIFSEDTSQKPVGVRLRKTIVYKYDESGNAIEEREYDPQGTLKATIVKKYDGRGNVLESTGKMEWGIFGLGPMSPIDFRDVYKYDEAGKLIETKGFLGNEPLLAQHSILEYDGEGRPIIVTSFTPTYPNKPPRIARHLFSYNKQGDIIESRYYEPIRESNVEDFKDKFEIVDDKGTVRNGTLVSDKPFMLLWTITVCEYKYDAHGNWTEKTCKGKGRESRDFAPLDREIPRRTITYYQ